MAVAVAAMVVGCAGILAPAQPASAAALTVISGAGSTWANSAIHSWIADVGQAGMTVNYTPNGSTSGRAFFKAGVADWAQSEIPYGVRDGSSFDPPPARGYAYLPDLAGGTAFTYNLHIGGQQVTNLRLSGSVIAGIFTNQITMWNDPLIAADNPGLTLPATPVIPVVRSDGDGSTWQFTQWMLAMQGSSWTAYCAVTGRSPCTATSTYPVQPGTAMVAEAGDAGVAGYVAQAAAEGAIGYTEYAFALQAGFPVAKVLNAAGYYTTPTAGNVGVSLLNAQLNTDQSSPLYLTADLSQVYTDPDPRTYELSSYSYMIVPTDLTNGMTTDKGYTLGQFGSFLLCTGQSQVDVLGYSALPINLVEAGFAQLRRIPGNQVPATDASAIAQCHNPTFSTDGTNTLAATDPMPPACDRQGATQCSTATGGPPNTSIALTASPDPATAGQPVTLTAVEEAADSTHPPGSVQFEVGGTAIGNPVPVNSGGAATTTTTFAAAETESLSAVFTSADATALNTSTGSLSLTVQPAPPNSGTVPLAVTIPVTGTFTLTVDTTDTVTLPVTGLTATGATTPVVVSDTRNTYPGWSVSGQDSDWTGTGSAAGGTIPGNQLGWTPTGTALAPGVTLGPLVTPGSGSGLGFTPQVLAMVHAGLGNGFGTSTLGADLILAIPPVSPAGPYTSGLNITAVPANP